MNVSQMLKVRDIKNHCPICGCETSFTFIETDYNSFGELVYIFACVECGNIKRIYKDDFKEDN